MGFSQAVRTCLQKYVTFSGRARRSEYWYFILFIVLCQIVLGVLDSVFFGVQVTVQPDGFVVKTNGPLVSVFGLATFLPTLTAGWRRMHDTGRSGLYLFYPLIVMFGVSMFIGMMAGFGNLASGNIGALIGAAGGLVAVLAIMVLMISPLLVLWWLTRPSQPDANDYGPPPV